MAVVVAALGNAPPTVLRTRSASSHNRLRRRYPTPQPDPPDRRVP